MSMIYGFSAYCDPLLLDPAPVERINCFASSLWAVSLETGFHIGDHNLETGPFLAQRLVDRRKGALEPRRGPVFATAISTRPLALPAS